MAKQIVAVDVDDVISVHVPSFVAYSNQKWGTNLSIENFDENWAAMWGITNDGVRERREVMDKERLARQQNAMEGAREVLVGLAKTYDLVITTSRHSGLIADTHEWIDEHFPGVFRDLYFAGIWDDLPDDGHLVTKADMLKKVGAHYLIDDQPKHCLAAAEIGIDSIIFGDYPWNRSVEAAGRVSRAHDWQEVKAYFDARAGQ